MPSYTRGKKRQSLVFVLVNPAMYFGFKPKDISSITGVSSADVAALGHLQADAIASGIIRVIGAQAPKPPRVTRRLSSAAVGQQKSVSTYCGQPSIGTAQAAGWNLTKSRRGVSLRALSASRGSLTAIATLSDGSKYCFPMNKADFEAFGTQLGLAGSATINSETERNKLVSGASIPYPGRAARLLEDGSTFSSFFSTASQGSVSEAGYDIVSEEKVIAPGVAPGGD